MLKGLQIGLGVIYLKSEDSLESTRFLIHRFSQTIKAELPSLTPESNYALFFSIKTYNFEAEADVLKDVLHFTWYSFSITKILRT